MLRRCLGLLKSGQVLLPALVVVAMLLFFASTGAAADSETAAGIGIQAGKNERSSEIIEKAARVQMPFIANEGQIENDSVMFYARTFGGTVYITQAGEIVYSLPKFEAAKDKANEKPKDKLFTHESKDMSYSAGITGGWTLKERLVGASNISPRGAEAVQTKVNYFIGDDKSKWRSSVAAYNTVTLGEVYPGIDLKLQARGNNVEKIFTIHPGAGVEQIKLAFEGAHSLAINHQGELEIETGLGPVRFTKPTAFQERDGKKEYVRVAYQLDEDHYGFAVEDYDKTRPLVIDPLLASTLIGGNRWDEAASMAIDSAGHIYVAGWTDSDDYPTTAGAYDASHNGGVVTFVSKLDANLSTLMASTFIGGSGRDWAYSLVIDGAGNVYVAGKTESADFPTTAGAYDASYNGGYGDVFVSKLDADLSALMDSTFIGGSDEDRASSMIIDDAGNVYVAGETWSSNFPTTAGAYDTSHNDSGYRDVFVAKLGSSLNTLLVSTFIGGNSNDEATSLTIDSAGHIYVAGWTSSDDYPATAGAYDTSHNGGVDTFVSKLDTDLSTLISSTFIGGSDEDWPYSSSRPYSLAADSAGNVYVTGWTNCVDYPTTAGAYDTSHNGGVDAFVSKFDAGLGALMASTFIGGSGDEYACSLAIESTGNIYVAGWTSSIDYPTTIGAYDTSHNGGWIDAFLSKLDTDLSSLKTSTYIGGSDDDEATSMAIDTGDNIYVTGYTYSVDYPLTIGAYDTSHNGGDDLFISKLTLTAATDDKSHLGKRSYCLYGNGLVNLSTGNFILEQTDLALPSTGPALALTRFYNSKDDYTGPLGQGWTHNYNTRLTINQDQNINVTFADGQVLAYTYNGSGYDRPAGSFTTLAAGPADTYVLTFKDQTQYTYNTAGQLISITDQNGNNLTLTYTNDLLTAATEPAGRSLTFTYDTDNRLAGIADTAGRTVAYIYDADGNLATVQDTLGGVTVYSYDNFGLTGITAPDGAPLLGNTYDSNGRVTQQTDGNDNTTLFNYDQPNRTTLTDAMGNIITTDYDARYRGTGVTYPGPLAETYTYDDNNCRTGITDSAGRVTTGSYDDFGNLLTIIDPAGNTTAMTYDHSNNLLSMTNPVGERISFTYDANGNLTDITDPLGNTTTYTYDGNGFLLSETTPAPDPGTTGYTYQSGLLQTITDPAGNTTAFGHDPAGRPVSITDAAGHTIAMTYDAAGNLLTVTDPLGNTTSHTYDWRGDILTETDARGSATVYQYDGNANLTGIIDALNNQTVFIYDAKNRLTGITDARGNTTNYSCDALDRITGITDPLGYTTQYHYDAVGNLTGQTDALGNEILTVNYDLLDNPETISDALGNTVTNQYDSLSRLTGITNPLGSSTQFDYDALNRLITTTDALSGQGNQEFDARGNRTAMTDPNSNRTNYSYDNADRLTGKTTAALGHTALDYNNRNLIAQKTNARGQTTTYQYDPVGRPVSFASPDGMATLTYDQNGNLLTAADSAGTTVREYDALNRITKYTDALGNTIQYAYDAAGNLETLTYPGGRQVQYEYDAAGQLIKVTDWAGRTTAYQYDPNGRLVQTLHPNGAKTTCAYDSAGRLMQLSDEDDSGNIISCYDYTYDESGSITAEEGSHENVPYTMDDAALTYTADNRLATYNERAVEYDADGNMTTGPLAGEMAGFAYDARGRLTGAGNITYTYDVENNRIRVSDGGRQTSYAINPNAYLSQVLIQNDAQGNQTYYVYGLGLIGQESPGGAYSTYHFNSRGDTVALTDDSGNVTDRFQYAPFGELLYRSGDTATSFMFSGRYGIITDESDLYYMRARYYNPVAKRFISPDTITGQITNPQSQNLYVYCEGNPVNYVDPTGRIYWPIIQQASDKAVRGAQWVGDKTVRAYQWAAPRVVSGAQWIGQNASEAATWVAEKVAGKTVEDAGKVSIDSRKFTDYIFKDGATHGKDVVFRNLGYGKQDSNALMKIYREQATQKYAKGQYTLGKADQYGQRIDIEIELSGIGDSVSKTSYLKTGWMINSDGSLSLNTPFTGFTR